MNMSFMKFFYKLLPHSHKVLWTNKHDVDNVFDDPNQIVERCRKNDTSMVMFISHTKKRPNCVTFIRLFDFVIMDAYEFIFEPIEDCSKLTLINISSEFKPMMVFEGAEFTNDSVLLGVKNQFIDFFKGDPERKHISINNIELCIIFSIVDYSEMKIALNAQYITKTKEDDKLNTKLEQITPTIQFTLNRKREINPDMMKEALRKPVPFTKQRIEEFKGERVKSKKVKNVRRDQTGLKGQVYVNQQDIGTKLVRFGREGESLKRKRRNLSKD